MFEPSLFLRSFSLSYQLDMSFVLNERKLEAAIFSTQIRRRKNKKLWPNYSSNLVVKMYSTLIDGLRAERRRNGKVI